MSTRLLPCVVVTLSLLLAGCASGGGSSMSRDAADSKVKALVDLGVGYIRNGEYARAKDNLNKALALEPRSAVAHNMFGLVFQLEGESALADEYFTKAIRLDGGYSAARNNYGAFLYEQGRFAEAVAQFEICADDRLYDRRSQVFESLGASYAKLGQAKKAEAAFVRSVQLNPSQPRALLALGDIRFEQQDYVAARSLLQRYNRVAQQNPKSLWLGIQLARIFEDADTEASYALVLKNIFAASDEYAAYQRSLQTP